ncbi:sulfotransferase [Gracilimonas sp.]|uniref:sulfotransferase n=1 Tax=Gracilimonas sp. TaxID=1974203 RepID=UPI0028713707|nr:sulfotransferase [Gracilimonas sp.]
MTNDFKKLNKQRTKKYRKSEKEESFLEGMNRVLETKEQQEYEDLEIDHPLIFVIGLPRSGTTLLTQIIAHGLKIGYINNITARFWSAPLHGLKLSDTLIGKDKTPQFKSDYGATESLTDIHEFGYFWRNWLNKDSFESITNAQEYEADIDWDGLKRVLANIEAYAENGFIFKNIYGSYHISKLDELLKKTLWVYVERDPLDVAISNLNARVKFYDDPGKWWSYVPPEYDEIKDLAAYPQIAGQLHYLKKFYYQELNKLRDSHDNQLFIHYDELCGKPAAFLDRLKQKVQDLYNYDFQKTKKLPKTFPVNRYTKQPEIKEKFESLLKEFQQNDPIPPLK